MEPPAIALTVIMHQVRLECLVQLPTLRSVELIALQGEGAQLLAHVVPGALVTRVVDAAKDAGEPSLLAQIAEPLRLLRVERGDQLRNGAEDDRRVRHV